MEKRIHTRKDIEQLLSDLEARKNNIKAKDEYTKLYYSGLYKLLAMYLQHMTTSGQDYVIIDLPTTMLDIMFGPVKRKRKVKR